jgi:hypothetical protein
MIYSCTRSVRAAFALALVSAVLSGCLLPRTELAVSYDSSQGEYIHQTGEGRIKGQAFLRRINGRPAYAAGRTVFLIPASDYAVARIEKLFGGGKFVDYYTASFRQFASTDPDYLRDQRTTRADHRGRFTFAGLAPGRYIVMTTMLWRESDLVSGGAFFDYVIIEGTETSDLVLSVD